MAKIPDWTYELHIHGTKPRDLPIEGLGEVLKQLSAVLGSEEQLRFFKLSSGSARVQVKVLEPATQSVLVRLVETRLADSGDKRTPLKRLDDCLSHRGWHAELLNRTGGTVLVFPGATRIRPQLVERTVQQLDTLVGTVISIGGRDDTVPMQLQTPDGSYVNVNVRGRELARQLARLIWERDIRVSGLATWKRDSEGQWSCTSMMVDSFEELSDQPLSKLLAEVRSIEGNKWHSLEDPISEWQDIRGDN